ncbi:unnamed protein product [Pedinophyceae sp. YPF-701]|nr:unnamed protein product [Pedinophyceae sp. YPF-701]
MPKRAPAIDPAAIITDGRRSRKKPKRDDEVVGDQALGKAIDDGVRAIRNQEGERRRRERSYEAQMRELASLDAFDVLPDGTLAKRARGAQGRRRGPASGLLRGYTTEQRVEHDWTLGVLLDKDNRHTILTMMFAYLLVAGEDGEAEALLARFPGLNPSLHKSPEQPQAFEKLIGTLTALPDTASRANAVLAARQPGRRPDSWKFPGGPPGHVPFPVAPAPAMAAPEPPLRLQALPRGGSAASKDPTPPSTCPSSPGAGQGSRGTAEVPGAAAAHVLGSNPASAVETPRYRAMPPGWGKVPATTQHKAAAAQFAAPAQVAPAAHEAFLPAQARVAEALTRQRSDSFDEREAAQTAAMALASLGVALV